MSAGRFELSETIWTCSDLISHNSIVVHPQIHEKKSLCVVLLYSCVWVYTSDMTKTAFTTRKYQVIDFDDIQVGDWIQRKTPTSARFSNTYLVKSVSNFTVGATTWTIVECGQTSFFRHHETSSTFRKVL